MRGIATECYRQSDRDMPNIFPFQNGLIKSKLTGLERGDQLFMLYLSMLPLNVRVNVVELDNKATNRSTKSHKSDNKDNMRSNTSSNIKHPKIIDTVKKFDHWLKLFETMISISQWLKLDQVPENHVRKSVNITLNHDTSIFDPTKLESFTNVVESNNYLEDLTKNLLETFGQNPRSDSEEQMLKNMTKNLFLHYNDQ